YCGSDGSEENCVMIRDSTSSPV
ncbi:uncharacterized, partial [Tachysurus ichikawai]